MYIEHNNTFARTRTFKPDSKGSELVPEPLLGGKLSKAPADVQKVYDEYPVKRTPTEWAFRYLSFLSLRRAWNELQQSNK